MPIVLNQGQAQGVDPDHGPRTEDHQHDERCEDDDPSGDNDFFEHRLTDRPIGLVKEFLA